MDKVDKYIDWLFNFIDTYQKKIKSLVEFLSNITVKLMSFHNSLIQFYIQVFSDFSKFARYTTYPIHWALILYDLWRMKPDKEKLPIFEVGAHYIYGKPGSGKSTMTYHAMMDYAYLTGKVSLTTAQMELPRINLSGASYYLHQRFKPSDLFIDGEQKYAIDTKKFNFIVYEEMLTQYNQRNNKESKYNNEFLPLIGALGTQRHQGIDLFYFISQLPKGDIQLMQLLNWYHEPKVKKGFDYKYWLETGKYRFVIKGWRIKSFKVTPKGSGEYELTNKRVWFYENTLQEEMRYFNPLNMKKDFENKPILKLEAKP
ncbi:hypothetical protein [Acholeplasma hippikon]|uniref:Uncharacterized protein n=1 Tax=Acholeplasma hippikon TaxID=264636 RepID=A0A449BLA2_9MOLU|nr:hypothetical protein [Acholeplasma hippikon]VEU83147.1 Uncharacterised protein [Acholeplasma hippikon]VEU83356.1 Uncharacterised protein [Acholeplasma hippikon]